MYQIAAPSKELLLQNTMVPSNYLQSIPEGHFQQRDNTTLGVCVCPRRTKVSKKHMLILAVLAVIVMVHPVNAQPNVNCKKVHRLWRAHCKAGWSLDLQRRSLQQQPSKVIIPSTGRNW